MKLVNETLRKHKDLEHCPTPGGWFWYSGKWKNRKNDIRIIFLKRYASDFSIIYFKRLVALSGYNFDDPEDHQQIVNINMDLSPARLKAISKKCNYSCKLCGADLLHTPYEIHHILPIKF